MGGPSTQSGVSPNGTVSVPADGNRRHGSLREQLRANYLRAGGFERVSYKQLDGAEAMIRYLSRVQQRSGNRILRSIPQMAKGLGLPAEGLTVRQIRDRYENKITHDLAFLELAGFVDHVERDLRQDDGQGIGIVVVLPAGVAQSVRATPSFRTPVRRVARRPPCDFSAGMFAPPAGGPLRGGTVTPAVEGEPTPTTARRAQGAPSTRERALRELEVRAALSTAVMALGSEAVTGERVFALRPVLATAPLELMAREAWREAGHPDGRLSAKMRQQLDRSSLQVERCRYRGLTGPAASRAAVIDLAFGDWSEHWWTVGRRSSVKGGDRPPIAAGALVFCLRRLGRKLKRSARSGRR